MTIELSFVKDECIIGDSEVIMEKEKEKKVKEQKEYYKGHRERLRNQLLDDGIEGFEDYEVIELLLQFAYPYIDTKKKAKDVLDEFENDIHKLFYANVNDLLKAGLSNTAATLIVAIRESFIYQYEKKMMKSGYIYSPEDARDYLMMRLKGAQNEEFHVIYLNTANKILTANKTKDVVVKKLFEGSKSESRVYIRDIIEDCIKYGATQILIAHNHPSGRLKPSEADISITLKIQEVLKIMEIGLMDHLIIGDKEFLSFKREGLF